MSKDNNNIDEHMSEVKAELKARTPARMAEIAAENQAIREKKEKEKQRRVKPSYIASVIAVVLFLGGLAALLFFVCIPVFTESEEEMAERLETREKGFHCLSTWDGNHDGFEDMVRQSLSDPESMKTINTLVGRNISGKHQITMNFTADNLLGGTGRLTAKGYFSNTTCDVVELTEIY